MKRGKLWLVIYSALVYLAGSFLPIIQPIYHYGCFNDMSKNEEIWIVTCAFSGMFSFAIFVIYAAKWLTDFLYWLGDLVEAVRNFVKKNR